MRVFKGNITSETVEDGAVTIVRISNPEKRNALEPDSYWSIGDAVNEADANPATRCVIVTGDDAKPAPAPLQSEDLEDQLRRGLGLLPA